MTDKLLTDPAIKILTGPQTAPFDLFYGVDVSDPTSNPAGTSFKITRDELAIAIGPNLVQLPAFGKYVASGLFGFATFYDPAKTAWNDPAGATGVAFLRAIHHSGPEYDLFWYASSADITPGNVRVAQSVNAATLADGRASIADVDVLAKSADGLKYVDLDVNVSIRPDGTQHSAGIFIDTDTISPSFGISLDRTQAYLPAFAGQTTPLVLLEDTSGAQCFAVGVTGYVDMTEQVSPAAPGANIARLYTKDVGGKTGLYVLFPSGVEQQIKVEA